MTNPRKAFTIIVNKKEYDVWNIPDKHHKPLNNEADTWWLYYSDRMPEGMIPPLDSEHWLPYHVSMKRRLWDIHIEKYQTTKVKWDELTFRSGYRIKMFCDNKPIYSFGTHDLDFALQKIGYLQVVLSEHPYNFFDQESEKNRKIYWYGLPAFVNPREFGEIWIVPDYSKIPKKDWWVELKRRSSNADGVVDKEWEEIEKENFNESMTRDSINWGDALSDGHIDWFRRMKEEEHKRRSK